MKKGLILGIIVMLICLVGCDMISGTNDNNKYNNDNLVSKIPNAEEEIFIVDSTNTYYESLDVTLWAEINGFYTSIKYFTLDDVNKNLRIYDDVYLYENDYFYMISNDNIDWFADLETSVDTIYAEKELEEDEDYSIVIKKSGIYKIIFDLETKKFNLEYKRKIDTPKYVRIKNCEVCQFINSKAQYFKMEINPDNSNELMLLKYNVKANDVLYFFNITHISNYKIILSEEMLDTVAAYANKKRQGIRLTVDGTINIYLNTDTYEVRITLEK